MTPDGWKTWFFMDEPPHGVLLEITRKEWVRSIIARREDIPPEANAVGLYWRLTGIGKMQMGER